MKKFFISFLLFCYAIPVFAETGSIPRKLADWWDNPAGKKCECAACPVIDKNVVCPDTPFENVKRPPFEIEAIVDAYSTPSGGSPQLSIENYTFRGKHNFSPVLNVYVSYSTSSVDKIEYPGSLYDKNWQYQTVMAGVGWYIHPVIEIFGGAGKVMAKNSAGSEELGLAVEYGVKAHYALNSLGYKIICGLLTREVPLADDNADITRSQAEASATYIFVGFALPIGY